MNINDEIKVLGFCIESLLMAFIQIKQNQQNSIGEPDGSRFRVPIQIHIAQHGKKYYLPTKKGKLQFTPRQIECIQCLIDGLSAKETALRLFLSYRTVETYLSQIKEKLECRTKRDIIRLVYAH